MAIREGTPPPCQVGGAHGVAGALGGDHDHVQVGARHDLVVVDVEAVGEARVAPFLMFGSISLR
jgi:hypothetical protein